MGDIKPFEQLLEATIKAPRLSGSKVTQLSELALSLVAHDHDLITTFFKLNSSLPPATQARISSLYVFDAIARAAHKGKGREREAQRERTERGKGTPGSLLVKLEGVVGSWVNGMLEDGKGGVWPEGKEKVRKIIDIWAKSSTFPQACLNELSGKINAAGSSSGDSNTKKLAEVGRQGSGQGSTTPPHPPPAAAPAPASQGGLPPEILKMLGISAPSPAAQTQATSTSTPAPVPVSTSALGGIDIQALLASVKPLVPGPGPATATATATASPVNAVLPTAHPHPHPLPTFPPNANAPAHSVLPGGSAQRPNLNLNQTQADALAKFAKLAQAGPPPHTHGRPGPTSQGQSAAGPSAYSSFSPDQGPPFRPPPSLMPLHGHGHGHDPAGAGPGGLAGNRFDPRGPPSTSLQGMGMSAEPMRGGPAPSSNRRGSDGPPFPSTQGQGQGQGPYPPFQPDGNGSGSMESGSYGRGHRRTPSGEARWGDRSSGAGAGSGPMRNRNHGRSDDRDRDSNPVRGSNQYDRPGGGFEEREREGRGGPNRYGRERSRSPTRRDGHGRGRSFPNANANDGESGFGRDQTYRNGPSQHGSRPPQQSQYQQKPAAAAAVPTGRAPPPEWMVEPPSPADGQGVATKTKNEGQDDGEADMALDESDDEAPAPGPTAAAAAVAGPGQTGTNGIGNHHQSHDNQWYLPPTSSMNQYQHQQTFPSPSPLNQTHPQPQINQHAHAHAHAHAPGTGMPTLDTFDLTTFDPSSPGSWSALAGVWKMSTGAEPDQMTLMNWVMMRMQGGGGGGGQ